MRSHYPAESACRVWKQLQSLMPPGKTATTPSITDPAEVAFSPPKGRCASSPKSSPERRRRTDIAREFRSMPLWIGPIGNREGRIDPASSGSTTRPFLSPPRRAGYRIAKLPGGPTGCDTPPGLNRRSRPFRPQIGFLLRPSPLGWAEECRTFGPERAMERSPVLQGRVASGTLDRGLKGRRKFWFAGSDRRLLVRINSCVPSQVPLGNPPPCPSTPRALRD